MNPILNSISENSHVQITFIICTTVLLLAFGVLIAYMYQKYRDKHGQEPAEPGEQENESTASAPEVDKAEEKERERKNLVQTLMKEIAAITADKIVYEEALGKKRYYEKYNDEDAKKLLALYHEIDRMTKQEG